MSRHHFFPCFLGFPAFFLKKYELFAIALAPAGKIQYTLSVALVAQYVFSKEFLK